MNEYLKLNLIELVGFEVKDRCHADDQLQEDIYLLRSIYN